MTNATAYCKTLAADEGIRFVRSVKTVISLKIINETSFFTALTGANLIILPFVLPLFLQWINGT